MGGEEALDIIIAPGGILNLNTPTRPSTTATLRGLCFRG
ncbi:conserved protein of unknown function [Limnospira indica PCC 8005]|uniref:Uncharacterized protein n=1 Tax=Limnospira indica PCC 8005 TaxID=376219 RepID=A0A9P1P157_9CYAN|nr:conserved protein of unknown function [Limnospira indica PCC 8005]